MQSALKSDKADVRFAAAIVVGDKKLPFTSDLIELLKDSDAMVTQAARRSLVVLSYHIDAAKKAKYKGFKPQAVDYGPQPTASKTSKNTSATRWKDFMTRNEKVLTGLNNSSDSTSKSSSK